MTRAASILAVLMFLTILMASGQSEEKLCTDLAVNPTKFPVYPLIGLAAHVGGTIRMDVKVNSDGKIISVDAIEGPELLRGAAKDFVSSWELGWHEERKHHACVERVVIDYKFIESTKSVSSYSYETVTEDGTSTTTVLGRPKYFKIMPQY
jgi:hypothetical protein